MKKILFIAIGLSLWATTTDAADDWQYVGFQPVSSFVNKYQTDDKDTIRIFSLCNGIDNNFDGVIDEDEGDIPPSIWKGKLINSITLSKFNKIEDFGFKINTPVNSTLTERNNILIPSGNNLIVYNTVDEKMVEIIDLGMYVVSVDAVEDRGEMYYIFGLRDYSSGKSYVRVLSREASFDKWTTAADNIVDARFIYNDESGGAIALSEGDFEKKDAQIQFFSFNKKEARLTSTLYTGGIGTKVSHSLDKSLFYVIMGGSHEIHIVDRNTRAIVSTVKTNTTGSGGPKDAATDADELLYVSTYSDQIQLYDNYATNPSLSFVKEGTGFTNNISQYTNNYIFVDNIQHTNGDPSNKIYFYTNIKTNVENGGINKKITPPVRIYPHPVANDFHLVSDDLVGELSIAIVDGQGKIVATHSAVADGEVEMSADELGLGAGNYTAIINGTKAVRFIVIK